MVKSTASIENSKYKGCKADRSSMCSRKRKESSQAEEKMVRGGGDGMEGGKRNSVGQLKRGGKQEKTLPVPTSVILPRVRGTG